MFLLRIFGGASLEDESGLLSGRAVQRRRLALLAILALEHPRPVSRDKLVAWLWPEHETERARHLLRDSLYLLRGALGEEAVPSAGDELRLNPDCVRCDVWDFEEAVAQQRPEEAVQAYSGPLLDGFHAGGASELEHWLDTARERVARAYAKALERLAEETTAEGDTKSAVEWWRRLAAEDRYNARVTLRLMAALEAAGDRAGAIQQARIHAVLLEQEFGAEPDPEVEALAERLRTSPAGRTAPEAVQRQAEGGGAVERPPEAGPARAAAAVPVQAGVTVSTAAPAALPAGATRHRRRLFGTRAVLVPAATGVGSLALLSVLWLLPEAGARPGAVTEAAVAIPKTIAVLPCANLSGDPEQEHFSDGLTEELTGVLAQVRALRVAARTSAFAFKGENRDIREIGEALNVGTLVECSVRRSGERMRVTAQLINAADGFHLWTETYEREGTDVFAIQSDLAFQIASALKAELTPAERARIARRPTASPEAHGLYLKGRHFWNQRTSSAYARALEYFERAIEADPDYAQAHAGLAYVYSMQGLLGDLTPEESGVRTRDAALRALELDPELAEAHTVLGGYYHAHAWESEAAERAHRRALELDPDYPTGRHWYANYLTSMERFDEAIAERRKAVELDPLSPHLSSALGIGLLGVGRRAEALQHLRNAIELDSLYGEGYAGMAGYYESLGRIDDAIRAYRRAIEVGDVKSSPIAGLASLLARAGQRDEARVLLAQLQAKAERTGIYPPQVAWVLLALDEGDGALAWLERSYQQKHPVLRFMGRSRDARLANNPQYLDLRRRIGLPH
jgi:TolB-like protein/DNA-binding SARP family transcriptional activator